jgi:tetratricopeptide (TPR) repeat protein
MLRPKKKIYKKEIKEDALVTFYFRAQKILNRYSKQINIGLTLVLAAVVIGVLMARSKRSSEIKAEGQLSLVEQYYYMVDYPRVIQEMEPIIKTYPGTRASGTAAFYAANAYFTQGKYDEAEKYYKKVIRQDGHDPMQSASALAGLAAVEESRGQFGKAAESYEEAGKKYGRLFSTPFYLEEAARCCIQANDKQKAHEILDALLKDYPENAVADETEFMKESL